jgi:hypothetical protein
LRTIPSARSHWALGQGAIVIEGCHPRWPHVLASGRLIRHSSLVPGRTSKLMLTVGSLVVLALGIGLAQLTRGAPESVPARRVAHAAEAPSAAPVSDERAVPAEAPSAAREKPAQVSAARPQVSASAKAPQLPAPMPSFKRELKRDENGNLVPIIPLMALREQLVLTEAPMRACIEKSGQLPTGRAMLNFTVGARNNKLLVDTTGVQDEDTLSAFPELLECMHKTAPLLLPEGRKVPELGTPIYVRRQVRIENGVLVEDSLYNFSYHP